MNRQEYLTTLEKALKDAGVQESAEILEEYAEHFDMKAVDGYGEEEIAVRLAPPEDIAGQFKEMERRDSRSAGGAAKVVLTIGCVLADIAIAPLFLVLYAWALVFGVFSIACACAGTLIIAGFDNIALYGLSVHLPTLPYISAVFLGISLFALAVLSAVWTEFCRLYITQMLKAYARWHTNTLGSSDSILPPLPLYPWVSAKKRRIMRTLALVSLVVFAIVFVVGFASMVIAARSVQPWHVWGWFE